MLDKLVSTKGRLARSPYALFVFCLTVATFISAQLSDALTLNILGVSPTQASLAMTLAALFELAFVWLIYAATVRRLNDMDGPRWPVWLFLLPFLPVGVSLFLPWVFPPFYKDGFEFNQDFLTYSSALQTISVILSTAKLITALVVSLIPGTKGDNRFGPSGRQPAEIFE
ncbi:DUF805 domain-containing protein [Asticcacaulis sp. YBE204]|uniref:DUF805 domain-containing protein n=1 Tax=Asticcacaulis sp. YBE204 TaxID=1282363 RepID=UPI0003C3FB4E|nr:DUF805 domain-containing protein [Asticcacaulis sp. YBE204]ESQ80505.1 hypothetical protein AEYBE204_04360 [Asticcacaulis sp. YBE204]